MKNKENTRKWNQFNSATRKFQLHARLSVYGHVQMWQCTRGPTYTIDNITVNMITLTKVQNGRKLNFTVGLLMRCNKSTAGNKVSTQLAFEAPYHCHSKVILFRKGFAGQESMIDEVLSVILDLKPNLGFFTETWLKDTVSHSHLCIPGYSFIYRNRTTDHI